MNKFVDIDVAVGHIKNLVDSIRCAICEKTNGTRMRYACGHTSCDDCVIPSVDCSLCLTPTSKGPLPDEPLTQRTENAINLLNAFQDKFNINVYKRQKISEQLKVEKELFPECIQAPAKYYNKRKSIKNTKIEKENRLSQLPGEEISSDFEHKMEQTSRNVEQWLNKHVRKPFADLNPNDGVLRRNSLVIKKPHARDTENENGNINVAPRKRPHFKSVVKSQLLGKNSTPVKEKLFKKLKLDSDLSSICDTSNEFKTGKNASKVTINSGKYIDDGNKDTSDISKDTNDAGIENAVIVLDDSQSVKVDKDYNAWLAVQEAEKQKQNLSNRIITKSNETASQINKCIKPVAAEGPTKVPFYILGSLADKCIECNRSDVDDASSYELEQSKDILITVQNKSFVASIKVTRLENSQKPAQSLHSVEVQTDEVITLQEKIHSEHYITKDRIDNAKEHVMLKSSKPIETCDSESQDLFTVDTKRFENKETVLKSPNKTGNVYIEESDSDEELEASVSLEVTAEIHRSCENVDYEILADIDDIEEHSKRTRRTARGFTPNSSDSSDKENYNPNRQKKPLSSKKKPVKK